MVDGSSAVVKSISVSGTSMPPNGKKNSTFPSWNLPIGHFRYVRSVATLAWSHYFTMWLSNAICVVLFRTLTNLNGTCRRWNILEVTFGKTRQDKPTVRNLEFGEAKNTLSLIGSGLVAFERSGMEIIMDVYSSKSLSLDQAREEVTVCVPFGTVTWGQSILKQHFTELLYCRRHPIFRLQYSFRSNMHIGLQIG